MFGFQAAVIGYIALMLLLPVRYQLWLGPPQAGLAILSAAGTDLAASGRVSLTWAQALQLIILVWLLPLVAHPLQEAWLRRQWQQLQQANQAFNSSPRGRALGLARTASTADARHLPGLSPRAVKSEYGALGVNAPGHCCAPPCGRPADHTPCHWHHAHQ